MVLPFLYSDDSEADSEFEHAKQRPERHESLAIHDVMVLRWRDRIASRPSSPSGSLSHDTLASPSKFPIAPVFAPPRIHRRSAILIRTHPNGPRKLLTARKRVGHFPARRLAWRRVSHRSSDRHSSPDFTSDSSSSGSSSDSSLDTSSSSPSDSLSDTSSVHSFGFDASESSLNSSSKKLLDSFSLFAGPFYKRCRSPTTFVPSSTPILRSIAATHADLLPPRKRFRDSYSPKDSGEEHVEIDTGDAEAVVDLGIIDGVRAHIEDGIGMGVEIGAIDIREDEEEFETAQK
ncbi:hypothetical protein Tco_1550782 [Tanacetum coccineum]